MKPVLSIIFLFLLTLVPSCFECREYVPQKFKFGVYYSKITAPDIISIGDKIIFSLTLPKYFYDSLSGDQVEIDKGIEIVAKLDEHVSDPVNPDDVFATPETIFKIFDQYFDLKIKKGQSTTVYNFSCAEYNGNWQIELEYTAKRKGMFYFSNDFIEINTSRTEVPEGVCMTGDAVLDAKLRLQGDNNKIEQIFKPEKGLTDTYYGFIVE